MSEIDVSPPNLSNRRSWWALGASVAALLAMAAILVVVLVGRGDDEANRTDPGPLDLATVAPAIADNYRFAESHESLFARIPCYCGCMEFLDHRNLFDCFVRPDGAGYEAHAAGCAVCTAQAIDVAALDEEGRDPDAIREIIDDRYGQTTATMSAV